jgi:hypothetical protein
MKSRLNSLADGATLLRRPRNVALRAGIGLLGPSVRWRRGKRQMRCIVENLSFLRGELVEATGLKRPLSSVGRHGAQALDGISNGTLAVRRQAPELRIHRPELLFLLRRQVFPRFHALKDLLLPVCRHTVEVLQPLLELLLPLLGQSAKVWIVLQRMPLPVERLLTILVQPLSRMMALHRRLISSRALVSPLRWGGIVSFRP